MKKEIPDDIVLVVAGFICGMMYLWCNLDGVKNKWDMWILVSATLLMILIPMGYSMYIYYKEKRKK